MTFSYDDSLGTDLDRVRFRIGDKVTASALLSYEEISAALTDRGSVAGACVACVESILAGLSRSVDRSTIGLSSSRSQAVQQYRDLLRDLKTELVAGVSGGAWSVGGISLADNAELDADTDWRGPRFRPGQDDNL